MRIAAPKSLKARSRSPLRVAWLPVVRRAAILALTGFTGGRGACGSAACGAASAAGATYGVAPQTAKSPAATWGPFSAFAGPEPQVMSLKVISLKAVKLSSQSGSFSVFGVSAARPRRETLRAQERSDVDDPPPHAAVIIAVVGARGSAAGAARTGAARVEPRPAETSATRTVTPRSPPGFRSQRSTASPMKPL